MTTAKAPAGYCSGWCGSGGHDRCRGAYAGCVCCCDCHTQSTEPESEDEPPPPGPAARLTRAAIALDVDQLPLPLAATAALARILRAEGAWAADRGDTYPDDRAPLLELADLVTGQTP